MEIRIWRTGGFAGTRERVAQVDTRSLDSSNASRIESAVRQAKFFELPEQVDTGEVGTDLYRYEIEVSDQSKERTVAFAASDPSRAGALGNLVKLVTAAAGAKGG